MNRLGAEATVLRAVPGFGVYDRTRVDGVVTQLRAHESAPSRQVVDRLCDESQSVPSVEAFAVQYVCDRFVDRSVTCLVNHN